MNHFVVILAVLLLTPQTVFAQERERSLALDAGRSSANSGRGHAELDVYRLAHRWGFTKTLWEGESSRIGGYWEASLNRWNGPYLEGSSVQDLTTTFLDWKNTPTESREYITPTLKLGTAYTHPIAAVERSVAVGLLRCSVMRSMMRLQVGSATGSTGYDPGAEFRAAFRRGFSPLICPAVSN